MVWQNVKLCRHVLSIRVFSFQSDDDKKAIFGAMHVHGMHFKNICTFMNRTFSHIKNHKHGNDIKLYLQNLI